MKKVLTWMLAGMLFVPAFAGCGEGSDEAVTNEDTGESALGDDISEEDYGAQMAAEEEKMKSGG